MDPLVTELANVVLRWAHVLCAIAWVGYAYFFVLAWAPVAQALAPEVRNLVAPQLIDRSMGFFRAVALLTWLTGLLLLGLVYHAGGLMVSAEGHGAGMAIGVGFTAMLVAFFPYDAISKSPLGKQGGLGGLVSTVLFCALAFGLAQVMPGRALFIHLGGTLGTVMLMNAAMRLAPAQRKLAAMMRGQTPFDPQVAQLVAQRANHNAVMSVAVVAYMMGYHFPSAYGHELAWVLASAVAVFCFGVGRLLVDALVPKPQPVLPAPPAP